MYIIYKSNWSLHYYGFHSSIWYFNVHEAFVNISTRSLRVISYVRIFENPYIFHTTSTCVTPVLDCTCCCRKFVQKNPGIELAWNWFVRITVCNTIRTSTIMGFYSFFRPPSKNVNKKEYLNWQWIHDQLGPLLFYTFYTHFDAKQSCFT